MIKISQQTPFMVFQKIDLDLQKIIDVIRSNDPDGSIASYAWAFGDGGSSNSASPNHTYASAGNFNISLTVTDNEGASSSISTTAFISEVANVAPLAVISNGPFSALEGVSISMSSDGSNDSDGNISSYQWNFGDGSTSTSANPSHTYSSAGSYQVSLTVYDAEGLSNTSNQVVTITNSGGGDGGGDDTRLVQMN